MSAFCGSNTIFSLPSSRSSVVAGAPLFCRPSSSTHDVGALQQLWPLAGWGSSPVTLRAYFLLLEPSNRTWMESIIDVDIAIDFVTGARDITKLSQNSRNWALSSLNRAASPSYLSSYLRSSPRRLNWAISVAYPSPPWSANQSIVATAKVLPCVIGFASLLIFLIPLFGAGSAAARAGLPVGERESSTVSWFR